LDYRSSNTRINEDAPLDLLSHGVAAASLGGELNGLGKYHLAEAHAERSPLLAKGLLQTGWDTLDVLPSWD